MAKKPSGTTGFISVDHTGSHTFHANEWPTEQKEIERKILSLFKTELEASGGKILSIKDGGTKELDFLLETPQGLAHLELMEIVFRGGKGSPFTPGHGYHAPMEYAQQVFGEVKKKIDKYGMRHEVPIDLLLYITHQKFLPIEAAIWALRRRFFYEAHCFQYVFLLTPGPPSAQVRVLFSKDTLFELPPIEAIRNKGWVNLDFNEAEQGEGSISFEIDLSKLPE